MPEFSIFRVYSEYRVSFFKKRIGENFKLWYT